ncbi:MAG TPA: methyltransferase domain-containing protein [Bacteroidota bacterium]|nr:methyltransferase domain-containing protein [Bacteroidota bacterium]
MHLFIPKRRYDPSVLEMMDRPNADVSVLRDDLKNLRRINKYFGGLAAVQTALMPLLGQIDKEKAVEILDLATGSGDHPLAVVKLARRLGRRVRIVAVDRNPVMLQIARELTAGIPEISIEEGEILSQIKVSTSFFARLHFIIFPEMTPSQSCGTWHASAVLDLSLTTFDAAGLARGRHGSILILRPVTR